MSTAFITPRQKRERLESPEPDSPEGGRLKAFRDRVAGAIESSKELLPIFVEIGTADAMHVEVVIRELREAGWRVLQVSRKEGSLLQMASERSEVSYLRIEP